MTCESNGCGVISAVTVEIGQKAKATESANVLKRKPVTIDQFYAERLEELNNKIVETVVKRDRARNLGISHLAQQDVRELLDHYPF